MLWVAPRSRAKLVMRDLVAQRIAHARAAQARRELRLMVGDLGAMVSVFRASERWLSRDVAVKILLDTGSDWLSTLEAISILGMPNMKDTGNVQPAHRSCIDWSLKLSP